MGGPTQVPRYLARYTHRVAISKGRIVGLDEGQGAFRIRDVETARHSRVVALPAAEFIGCFLSRVPPKAFKRIQFPAATNPRLSSNLPSPQMIAIRWTVRFHSL